MKYSTEIIPVCTACLESPDYDGNTKQCVRCGIAYCVHYASTTDARYCGNCFDDMKVTETIEIKETIYENSKGEEITRKRQIGKSLRLEGTDWLFANTQISLLTDEELLTAIEYHRNIAGIMLLEKEERKTEQLNRLSKVKVVIKRPEARIPKEKVAKTAATQNQAAIAAMLKGLSPEELAKLLAGLMQPKP